MMGQTRDAIDKILLHFPYQIVRKVEEYAWIGYMLDSHGRMVLQKNLGIDV
jgi:hypothetical protein